MSFWILNFSKLQKTFSKDIGTCKLLGSRTGFESRVYAVNLGLQAVACVAPVLLATVRNNVYAQAKEAWDFSLAKNQRPNLGTKLFFKMST